MKFSYPLLKKLVPEIGSKRDLIEKLNLFVFEAEDGGGDAIEVAVPANRFSSAGHWQMAVEIAAVYGGQSKFPLCQPEVNPAKSGDSQLSKLAPNKNTFSLSVETGACRRIIGQYFEGITVKPSPRWLQKILETCGLRPINNVVDITNYVMLETGQPLHAFDCEKVRGGRLIVRPARPGEKIATLDGQEFHLNADTVVIADEEEPLDVAGIKGGQRAQISGATSRIILTAANFDGVSIYRTARRLKLITDASSRNSHHLTPALIGPAIARAGELIAELAGGRPGKPLDMYQERALKIVLKFDIQRFNRLTGLTLPEKTARQYLQRLGFALDADNGRVTAPFWRDDIERFEDLAEEVVRLHGYHNLPAIPPRVPLRPSDYEEAIVFKDTARGLLVRFGLSEVYNYSLISRQECDQSAGEFFGLANRAATNPFSTQFECLRSGLVPGLLKNIDDNFRFLNTVRLFEIGRVFQPEKTMLGLALASKKEPVILEIKGLVDALLEQIGLVDRHYPNLNFELPFFNQRESLRIESDHHVIGYIGSVKGSGGRRAVAELDMEQLFKLAEAEKEYEPPARFPSIMRDLSLLTPRHLRVNQIMEVIENSVPRYLDDIDLIDFYESDDLGENFKSLTFRLVFLANDRTLTDREVDEETQKIAAALLNQLGIETR